jgi:hypothetical protein
LMLPLTAPSLLILIVPVADADVVTGGVSSAPVKVTCTSFARADTLLKASAAAAKKAQIRDVSTNVLMAGSKGLFLKIGLNCSAG